MLLSRGYNTIYISVFDYRKHVIVNKSEDLTDASRRVAGIKLAVTAAPVKKATVP